MNDDDDSKLRANRINWVLGVWGVVYKIFGNFTHQHSLKPLSKFKEATILLIIILCFRVCVSVHISLNELNTTHVKLNNKIITVMNNYYYNLVIFDSLLKYNDKLWSVLLYLRRQFNQISTKIAHHMCLSLCMYHSCLIK